MIPSTNLFDIIHSLTASEKRYFKIFSSTHVIGTKNNYEKLFNAICELPANQPYNEAAFKKKLSGKTWAKNFAVEKKFLEDILMKAMRAYNAEKSAEGALNDIIANVHFLYNKGLLNAASKELKKGIELGEEMENLPGLIILYQLKLNLTRVTQTASDIKTADEDLESETRILRMLDTERKVVHARRKIYNFYISGQLSKKLSEINVLVSELEHLEASQYLTYKARMSLFFLRAMIAEKDGRFTDAMKQYEEANAIWKKNELKLNESYSNLRMILSNYLVCAHAAERFDVYPSIIEQLESFPMENIKDQANTFFRAKGSRLLYLLNTSDKSGSEKLVKEIEDGLIKFQQQISRHDVVHMYTNLSLLLFLTHNYEKLVEVLTHTFAVIGRDEKMYQQLSDLRFLEIMAHFSLKNYELLDYQLRNTDRWLREHKLNEPFTDALIKSIPGMRTRSRLDNIKTQIAEQECSITYQLLKALVLEWLEFNLPLQANARNINASHPA